MKEGFESGLQVIYGHFVEGYRELKPRIIKLKICYFA
jgi:hypothetical protein